jgi:hypothetical protein
VVLTFYRGPGLLGAEIPVSNSRRFTADAIDVRGGVNWDSRGGNQGGGVRGLDWYLNDGGRAARGDQMRRGAVEMGFGSAGTRKGVELTGRAHLAAT